MMTTNVWLNQTVADRPTLKLPLYSWSSLSQDIKSYQEVDLLSIWLLSILEMLDKLDNCLEDSLLLPSELTLTSRFVPAQEWTDYKLKWDPTEYGGIEDINLPAEQIWLPDIALYNSAEGTFAVSIMTKAKVRSDGHVTWNPPAIFRSSCQIDITYFPFDSQNCHLKFGSWTFGTKIDLRHFNDTDHFIERGTDLSEYYQNVEWDIMQATAKRNVITYTCCPNDFYPDVTFHFKLRRKPLFYTVNLIMPCVTITILSFFVFYLPSGSGEKVTLTISILISLIFILSVLIETIPSTSLVMPLLGKYLVFTTILITLSVCATVCVLNIHFRTPSTHSMAPWIKRWCIDILPKYLFMSVPHYQSQQVVAVLPEQLVYAHNAAYACQTNQRSEPETLLANYLSPVWAHQLSRQATLNASFEASTQSKSYWRQNSLRPNGEAQCSSSLSTSCPFVELDPSKLNDGLSKQLPLPSSSLFLPYLQSEAARRLQLQRSRSSDRDNPSASDCQVAASSYCDTKNRQNVNRKTHHISSTAINIQSASSSDRSHSQTDEPNIKSTPEKITSDSTKTTKASRSVWRLFSSRSKSVSSKNSGKGKKHTTGESQDESSSSDNHYRHHQNFQARASVCSTNMWRIGPTRRCSIVAPVNYPTYYTPLVQPQRYYLAPIDGCLHQGHCHLDPNHSAVTQPAVSALVSSAARNSLIRPKSQMLGAFPVTRDIQRIATRATPELINFRQVSSTMGPNQMNQATDSQVGNSLNQIQYQHQQPSQLRCSSSNTNLSGQFDQRHPIQPQGFNSGFLSSSSYHQPVDVENRHPMSNSRSFDQRLSSLQHSNVRSVATDEQYPILAPVTNSGQQSLSIGRALGQAYMQRLQRQPTVYSMQNNPNQRLESGIYLRTLGVPINGDSNSNQEMMRRSRSQNSLDRRAQVFNLSSDCEQCNNLIRKEQVRTPVSMSQLRDRINSMGESSIKRLGSHSRSESRNGSQRVNETSIHQTPDWSDPRRPVGHSSSQKCETIGNCGYIKQIAPSGRPSVAQQSQLNGSSLMRLIGEVDKAIQNAMFIAQHIDNLDEFESVKENWKYIAMVIDRIFLIVFLFACIVGTVTIFAMVPWSYYTDEMPIDLQLTRLIALNLTGAPSSELLNRSCP